MKYTELMKCKKSQIKKNMKWADVVGSQICVRSPKGRYWLGNKEVTDKKEIEGLHVAEVSSKQLTMYFIEKAMMNGMKGVRLYAHDYYFSTAKFSYFIPSEVRWMFIANDWKSYDMDGKPIKVDDPRRRYDKAPHAFIIQAMKYDGSDLRVVGKPQHSICMSPASVKILKEAGFDMGFEAPLSYDVGSYYSTSECPEDSYRTDWFVENLIHPNRIRMKRKELEKTPFSYNSLKSAMGGKGFAVLENGGKPYMAIDHGNRIVVSPILVHGEKDPGCWVYDDRGSKKLRSYDDVRPPYVYQEHNGNMWSAMANGAVNVIKELLNNRPILEETDVFPNLVPELEKTLKYLNLFVEVYPQTTRGTIERIYSKLSYLMRPQGQKDKTFEQSIKENGLENSVTISDFLRRNDMDDSKLYMGRKTPYGQANLPKFVYYELKKLNESGKAVCLGAMIRGITNHYDDGTYPVYSSLGFEQAKTEFFACLPHGLIEKVSDALPQRFYQWETETHGIYKTSEFWITMIKFGGCEATDTIPAKIKAVERMLAKLKTDDGLLLALTDYNARDYFRQIKQLAPLGLNWPQKYDEFRMSNIMWFLNTIRDHKNLIDYTKRAVMASTNIDDWISALHDLQNDLSSEYRNKLAAATEKELDKMYFPWREKLKKALAWKGDAFGIFIPEHLAELTAEGSSLRHCVGSYKKEVAQGLEGILFLRKLSDPNVSYYTIDVVKSENGKYIVRQCHGKCNCQPTPEVIDVLTQWANDTGKVDAHSIKSSYGALCAL